MLKRITTAFIGVCLILLVTTPASAHSILWVSTSDHTDLIKDEAFDAAPVVLFMVAGVDEDASLLIEETDGDLQILYEESCPPELIGVEDEAVPPDLIIVEEEPEAELEEIELEEITNDEIQIP